MADNGPSPRSWTYKLTNSIKEDHAQPIYCVCFNFLSDACTDVFASCGGDRATIYRCLPGGPIEILQAYVDDDKEEEFFACKWSVETRSGAPLLLVAGKKGLLKVLNCVTESLHWCAEGHGDAINDIAVHPTRPSLVLTASRDSALRLWNLETKVCVLIMNGDGGHRNEVLSIDFHPLDGSRFMSSGMDNTVKIWSLDGLEEQLERSFAHPLDSDAVFDTKQLACPKFSSHKVHFNYVDCVRWLGDLCCSKSVDERIFLWRPEAAAEDTFDTRGHIHLVQELELEDSKMWFVRFSLDRAARTLACGNRAGSVLLWDPHELSRRPRAKLKRTPGAKTTVRQTAVSADASIIISCCDDATIWRHDCVPKGNGAAAASSGQAASAPPPGNEDDGMQS